MIEILLYGRLRQYGPPGSPRDRCVVRARAGADDRTVGDLLARLGIPPDEVASVFADGRWVRAGPDTPVAGITRLGLFPPEMGLLYV
jgi:hypothetical protein